MTFIFDLDGTLMPHHKTEWLPGVKEMLLLKKQQGHNIVFITGRGPQDDNTEWSILETEKFLEKEKLNIPILYNMSAGRVIIDDRKPYSVHWPRNKNWNDPLIGIPDDIGVDWYYERKNNM